jgi:hypothetical protein
VPPNSQVSATTAGRAILTPGDRVKYLDDLPVSFGDFALDNDPTKTLERLGVVIGIYAAGGTGKTTFFCSICDRKLNPERHDLPMLCLDAEAGIKSVAHYLGKDLQRLTLHSFADLERWVALARAQPKHLFPWHSVYLDNLSDLVGKALEEQGFHNRAPDGSLSGTSSQPDFNAMTTRVVLCLHDLRDLAEDYGFNLFISLWDQTEKDEKGNILGWRADLTPRLSTKVQGTLDYIGYMTVLPSQIVINGKAEWVRKLDFSPNPMLDSKWRVTPEHRDEIPFELYQPTLPAILDTIKRGVPFPRERFRKPVSATTHK